jgi:hypothetical protein
MRVTSKSGQRVEYLPANVSIFKPSGKAQFALSGSVF